MLSKEILQDRLNNHPLIQPRLKALQLAEKLNPDFRKPHIVGGYLRNVAMGALPRDCDVVFEGVQLNQPWVLETVYEAESRLGQSHYPAWEFENITATGMSGDLLADSVGEFSHHTDYLTVLLMNTQGVLYLGYEQTLRDMEEKVYDLRFKGVEVWAKHRAKERSYASCLTGDLIRAIYLCQVLDVHPSAIVEFLLADFDHIFSGLDEKDQEARINFWLKKTKGDPAYWFFLNRFGITTLPINNI